MLLAALRARPARAAAVLRRATCLLAALSGLLCSVSLTAGPAIAAGPGVTVQLTADEGQDPYGVGARVDVRARVRCPGTSACGPVELVVTSDRSLAFDSYSVVNDQRADPNHYPDVAAVLTPERASFTIGATEPIAAGGSVVIPLSARGRAVPEDGLAGIKATAATANASGSASLWLSLVVGKAPAPALGNLTLTASPSSVRAAAGATASVRLVVANTGDAPVAAGWRVTVLVPDRVRLLSLSGPGQHCSGATCAAAAALAPGGTSAPLTAVIRVDGRLASRAYVVAYVRPAAGDVAESIPLGKVPLVTTNASASATDNDAMVGLNRSSDSDRLPYTGGRDARGILALGLLLVTVGGGLLSPWWRRAAN
jgi:hypothetical protein